MSAANKRKGSLWESTLENFYNAVGLKCRRLPRAGAKDIGDLAIELKNGHVIVVEAKDVKANDVQQWLREADIEAGHYEDKYKTTTYGIVVRKTRQKGADAGVVMMTNETFENLLKWEGLA
jgi:Holliday junction resolvase